MGVGPAYGAAKKHLSPCLGITGFDFLVVIEALALSVPEGLPLGHRVTQFLNRVELWLELQRKQDQVFGP